MIIVPEAEFREWRQQPLTKAFLEEVAEAATLAAQKVLTSDNNDGYRDQYLKGILNGLAVLDGWMPEFTEDQPVAEVQE